MLDPSRDLRINRVLAILQYEAITE
ncbi:hypothetical protein EYZ11_003531 [Aspergillus tanneri]|uniref:Uncharacterized protein n=1 Tax=Aspergillus tanneri TaxID=1220188 RepID=A0A4S3JN79_9EURO|nr:hypothetical protein EYZ11_003531 [Aspergillus tanneri]